MCLLSCLRCLDDANDVSGADDNDAASLVSSMVSLFWWLSVVPTTTQVCLLCSFWLFHDAARWCRPTTHVLSPAYFRCFMTDATWCRLPCRRLTDATWCRLPCRRQPATACLVSSVVSSFHDWRNVVPTTVPPATSHGMSVFSPL